MKRVFVCSPLRGASGRTTTQNVELAKRLCREAVKAGVAPFAPHVFYPALGLDDTASTDRSNGIAAGMRWLAVADELWVYAEGYDGCSDGMKAEIDAAMRFRVPVDVKYMPECWRGVRQSV